MKKILIVSQGDKFSKGAFEFARLLNNKKAILLTGVFLPQHELNNVWEPLPAYSGSTYSTADRDTEKAAIRKNVQLFEGRCKKEGIEYRVHDEFNEFILPEFKKETRFADLAVIGSNIFEMDNYFEEILHCAECPVLVVPENYETPCINILAYDGSSSSVFAIKQFANLFPQWLNNETMLIYANEGSDSTIPEQMLLEEFLPRHFHNPTFCKLYDNSRENFASMIESKYGAILVAGALGRSSLSRLFKKSFIDQIVIDRKMPFFISHR